MQKFLIIAGLAILVIGLLWPWVGKIPFGRLPGDIMIVRPNFKLYLPVTSMILVSLVLSVIFWFLKK